MIENTLHYAIWPILRNFQFSEISFHLSFLFSNIYQSAIINFTLKYYLELFCVCGLHPAFRFTSNPKRINFILVVIILWINLSGNSSDQQMKLYLIFLMRPFHVLILKKLHMVLVVSYFDTPMNVFFNNYDMQLVDF